MSDTDTRLKFAAQPLRTLAKAREQGSPAATIRYDDEKGIRPGDTITVVDADTGGVVGEAVVDHVAETQVYRALDAVWRHGGIYPTRQVSTLLSTLNRHYDDEITPSSDVKVIFLIPTRLRDGVGRRV